MQRACVVLTTIFDPVVLESYYRNFERYGRLDNVEVIVIPDKKTPGAAYARCRELTARGLRAECPTIEEQEAFLKSAGLSPQFIPYNSDHRRNVGYLMALARDCNFLISIDDDNYALDTEDVFAEHSIVAAAAAPREVVESSTGYFNICDAIEFEGGKRGIYPRGFPFAGRHKTPDLTRATSHAEVHINAGLWVLDPDVEGITWLVADPHGHAFRGPSQVLGPGTWSPVNTQNTALRREAIAAYYFVRMGYRVGGTPIDRYGDIFSGYFVEACAKHLGGLVRFGTPVAEHRRNTHNYLRDATMEWGAILVLEEVLPWLRELKLTGADWQESYRCLSDELASFAARSTGPAPGFLLETSAEMKTWLAACARLR